MKKFVIWILGTSIIVAISLGLIETGKIIKTVETNTKSVEDIEKWKSETIEYLENSISKSIDNKIGRVDRMEKDVELLRKKEIAPTGSIVVFAGSGQPDGWLLCDGESYSVDDYPKLFSRIQYTYGQSQDKDNGKYKFNVPNLCRKFVIGRARDGMASQLGESGGDRLHSHSISRSNHAHFKTGANTSGYSSGQKEAGEPITTGSSESLPPYLTLNFIIRT